MRTIKFRLMKDNKIVSTQELKPNGIIDCPVGWDIACQFTGLLDKQGKEIYEGDILTILAEDSKINKLVVKYGIARREMKSGWIVDIPCFYFDLMGANFKAFPIVKNYKGKHDLTMLEIIGNIWENPELLNKEPL